MTRRLRSWKELINTPLRPTVDPEQVQQPTPLRTVTMPQNGLPMRPDKLVVRIVAQIEDNDIDLLAEPTAEMVADWKRYDGHRWTAWGPLCLVCHADVSEGEAVSYPFVLGSRACIGICSTIVSDLLRIYDRSERGRWRPTKQVHTLVNGARCPSCVAVSR